MLILKTKELEDGDPENKGLTAMDPENKAVRVVAPTLSAMAFGIQWTQESRYPGVPENSQKKDDLRYSSLILLGFQESDSFYFIDSRGFSGNCRVAVH